MTDLVVAKFGGTSVADFDAMNRSIDVALLDANTRIVVLSASAGVTNILVALAGGLEPTERFSQLDALRQIHQPPALAVDRPAASDKLPQ